MIKARAWRYYFKTQKSSTINTIKGHEEWTPYSQGDLSFVMLAITTWEMAIMVSCGNEHKDMHLITVVKEKAKVPMND